MDDFLKEIRKETSEAQNQRQAEAKKKAEEAEDRFQDSKRQRFSQLDGTVETIKYMIEKAAKQGDTSLRYLVSTDARDFGDYYRWRDEITLPFLDMVCGKFKELGFTAKPHIEHTTEYYSDGAGAGPVEYYVEISW